MARLPRYNLTYIYTESGEIKILDGEVEVDRFGSGNSPREDLPLMVWDDNDDTGVRLISSPNDFGLRIYTLEGHESKARHEFLNNTIAQIGSVTKAPRPKVVVTHAVVLRGVGEDVWKFEPNGTEIHATLNGEDQGVKSYWEWQTYIFKKYGALNPETL